MDSIEERIKKLKQEKNAVILAHYYQCPEIQQIADYVGDSYYLSKIAKETGQELIIFCGVRFMAESAKIRSPHKKVLLPVADAGCPMADMADINKIKALRKQYPDGAVVCYINTSVEVKALCDVCVTSSNAFDIIRKLPERTIIFLPDRNLSAYIADKCPEKEFIIYPGYCIVHNKILPEHIMELKIKHPNVPVVAHPECRKEVLAFANFVGSTGEMLSYAKSSDSSELIVVTEEGIRYALEQQNPRKIFHFPYPQIICANMKKTTIENVLWALEDETTEIHIDEALRISALNCLNAMHRLGN
ncbi:MAG: quinolinate synthase NadA [Defluviitaleaceae bacterium]|nr:quinolinate synthase NadA [Defluviitaleaceae bacterium]